MSLYNKNKNKEAFDFLLKSGKKRLKNNEITGAYSEFNLAHNIYPNNKELNQLLIETLSILCENDSKYNMKLDFFLPQKNDQNFDKVQSHSYSCSP